MSSGSSTYPLDHPSSASQSSSNNPPTSPRLPSPPPPVEDLSNPASPSFMPTPSSPSPKSVPPALTATANRRIRKGTKAKDIAGPPLVPLSDLESAFQLQEHLAALLSSITNPPNSEHVVPLTRKDCEAVVKCPEGIDEWMWCYELTRRLTRDLNHLVVGLLGDNCTEETCPEMRASLWQYLCAVHDPPRSCCAMDYSVHTLDHAANTLCSTKHFPSRLNINANGTKQISSIFRRLYRIFAHAWFLHRGVFWDIENEYGLYVFFRTVSDKYNLIPEDNLTIPSSANGGYDGITPEDGGEFDRMGSDGRGSEHDSDLEDDIDADGDFNGEAEEGGEAEGEGEGEVRVVYKDEESAGSTAEEASGEPSEQALSDLLPSGIKEDFPLFVFPEGEGNPEIEEETKELQAPNPPQSLKVDLDPPRPGELEDQSPIDGHRIEMKLDIGEPAKEQSKDDNA
ncbi:hypothetical protein ABW19_dt0202536 [Dactylella cylindrospora]|nr:hypothetical protein ABW19_dt0202536 [Dactylella cylindrospora]